MQTYSTSRQHRANLASLVVDTAISSSSELEMMMITRGGPGGLSVGDDDMAGAESAADRLV